MITIISFDNHVTVSKLESTEILKNEYSCSLFINGYEMIEMKLILGNEMYTLIKLRNKILKLFHSIKNGIYNITSSGELIKNENLN